VRLQDLGEECRVYLIQIRFFRRDEVEFDLAVLHDGSVEFSTREVKVGLIEGRLPYMEERCIQPLAEAAPLRARPEAAESDFVIFDLVDLEVWT
jgi:hypothetical protein